MHFFSLPCIRSFEIEDYVINCHWCKIFTLTLQTMKELPFVHESCTCWTTEYFEEVRLAETKRCPGWACRSDYFVMSCCLEHCPIQSQVVRHSLIFQILCIHSPLQVILLIVCVCVCVHIHSCMCGQVYAHYHTCLHVWTGVCIYMPACVDRCMGHCVLGVSLVGQRLCMFF